MLLPGRNAGHTADPSHFCHNQQSTTFVWTKTAITRMGMYAISFTRMLVVPQVLGEANILVFNDIVLSVVGDVPANTRHL